MGILAWQRQPAGHGQQGDRLNRQQVINLHRVARPASSAQQSGSQASSKQGAWIACTESWFPTSSGLPSGQSSRLSREQLSHPAGSRSATCLQQQGGRPHLHRVAAPCSAQGGGGAVLPRHQVQAGGGGTVAAGCGDDGGVPQVAAAGLPCRQHRELGHCDDGSSQ